MAKMEYYLFRAFVSRRHRRFIRLVTRFVPMKDTIFSRTGPDRTLQLFYLADMVLTLESVNLLIYESSEFSIYLKSVSSLLEEYWIVPKPMVLALCPSLTEDMTGTTFLRLLSDILQHSNNTDFHIRQVLGKLLGCGTSEVNRIMINRAASVFELCHGPLKQTLFELLSSFIHDHHVDRSATSQKRNYRYTDLIRQKAVLLQIIYELRVQIVKSAQMTTPKYDP